MPSETPGPTRKDIGLSVDVERPRPKTRAEFLASPDFFVFDGGQADTIQQSLPDLFSAHSDVPAKFPSTKSITTSAVAIEVEELSKYMRKNGQETVSDKSGQTEVLPLLTRLVAEELINTTTPDTKLRMLRSGLAAKDGDMVSKVKGTLEEMFTLYPGQLQAVDNLLGNPDFEIAAEEYATKHADTGALETNNPVLKNVARIETYVASQRKDLLTPLDNDDDVALLKSQGIPLPDPKLFEPLEQ